MTAPMYYIDIYESERIHACLFGFKSRDFVFPLHNHPDMYGFMKVLRGALAINSYTELSHDERALKRINSNELSSNVTIARCDLIFDFCTIRSSGFFFSLLANTCALYGYYVEHVSFLGTTVHVHFILRG